MRLVGPLDCDGEPVVVNSAARVVPKYVALGSRLLYDGLCSRVHLVYQRSPMFSMYVSSAAAH